jgi:methylmalonyl-CoA/ethylmalonyl-CoA epimerase
MNDALESVVAGLHHVAIVVDSIEAVRPIYVDALGMTPGEVEFVADQAVNVLVVQAGSQRIELVEPAGADSPVSKFLAKRGGGLHHLAYRVENLEQALDRLRAAGLRLIDETPRPGAHGTRIAFLHPQATGGVLTELVEDPSES